MYFKIKQKISHKENYLIEINIPEKLHTKVNILVLFSYLLLQKKIQVSYTLFCKTKTFVVKFTLFYILFHAYKSFQSIIKL